MRSLIGLFLVFFLSACTTKLSLVEPIDKENFKDLNITYDWYKAYDNANLNEFMHFVLLSNADINLARKTLLLALARADLIDYDLYPSLAGNLAFETQLNSSKKSNSFSSFLSLNYELDIYGKIRASVSASEFRAKASAYDLENLKISIINKALNNVFELAYFNDVDKLLKEYLQNLEQMQEFYTYKYELGKIEELDLLNIKQTLLKAEQNLLKNEQNRNLLIKNLQDLLAKEENFVYIEYFKNLSLDDFKKLDPNFNIPLKALAYRADVRSKFNALKGAFKDFLAVQKSFFPSISLGTVLRGEGKFDEGFKFELLGTNVQLSLPFLDYARIKQNVKISQFSYEQVLISYEQSLQSAMNEFALNYKNYQSNTLLLQNLQNIKTKQELIAKLYYEKYLLGKSELKDYLNASNALNSFKQEFFKGQI